MGGLVDEIQREALDPNTKVSTLLRKVKLAAVKLQLPAIEDWVDKELRGYKGSVPPYRQLHGTPRAFNPYQGWIPIMAAPKQMAQISRAYTGQSIASLEDVLDESGSGALQMPLSPALIQALNKGSDVSFGEMANFISRGQLAAILDQVRTMVLDWAIELEKSGIKGEGMSFKPEEKVAAQSNPGIAIGSVGTLVGVVGNGNSLRDIVGGDIKLADVKVLADQLRLNHASLVDAGASDSALSDAASALDLEINKPEPNSGIIRGLLQDARSALAGATGNLLATGALSMIGTLLGS